MTSHQRPANFSSVYFRATCHTEALRKGGFHSDRSYLICENPRNPRNPRLLFLQNEPNFNPDRILISLYTATPKTSSLKPQATKNKPKRTQFSHSCIPVFLCPSILGFAKNHPCISVSIRGSFWLRFGQLWQHLGTFWRSLGAVSPYKNTQNQRFHAKNSNFIKKEISVAFPCIPWFIWIHYCPKVR